MEEENFDVRICLPQHIIDHYAQQAKYFGLHVNQMMVTTLQLQVITGSKPESTLNFHHYMVAVNNSRKTNNDTTRMSLFTAQLPKYIVNFCEKKAEIAHVTVDHYITVVLEYAALTYNFSAHNPKPTVDQLLQALDEAGALDRP